MLVIPISSAQCEHGFSAQKRIKSDVRSSLHVSTTEDLIRISMEGPELAAFDPTAVVEKWPEIKASSLGLQNMARGISFSL